MPFLKFLQLLQFYSFFVCFVSIFFPLEHKVLWPPVQTNTLLYLKDFFSLLLDLEVLKLFQILIF